MAYAEYIFKKYIHGSSFTINAIKIKLPNIKMEIIKIEAKDGILKSGAGGF